MGGDLTGKAIVPIETAPGRLVPTTFIGETEPGTTRQELEELLEAIRFNGMYPWLAPRRRDRAAARRRRGPRRAASSR